jgi:homoserine kinase
MAHVSVPATSANLGAGFDCIGLAVDRRLEVDAIVTPYGHGEVRVTRLGTLAESDIAPEKDLLYTGFCAAANAAHRPFNGDVHFTASSSIPVARGLGSSAAAVVAGAVLANETLELGLSVDTLVDICSHIEGHPDNVAAALYGGRSLAYCVRGRHLKLRSSPCMSRSRLFLQSLPLRTKPRKREASFRR